MSVKAKLAELRSRRRAPAGLPAQSRTFLAAQTIPSPGAAVIVHQPPDRDQIAERLHFAFRTGCPPDAKDLKEAAWCLWEGSMPLASDARVLEAYLAHVRKSGSKRLFRRLASVYLISFPRTNPTLGLVAKNLASMAPQAGQPWSRASEALHLFDPQRGPAKVAELALAQGSTPSRVLEDHGIRGLAAGLSFAEAAFLRGLGLLRTSRPSDARAHLEQIKAWVLDPEGRLMFEQHRRALVEAVVLPWSESASKETRDGILSFLLARFGDPRIKQAEWTRMDGSPALGIVKRWLIDQSLRQFLDVVDVSATREDQWMYRRAFWEAVYRHDLISDAWVIFDPIGVANARMVFDDETPFGRWRKGRPIQQGQACLLLRIGGGVVAEWSQNGMCHIWPDAMHPTAPKLYQPLYSGSEARHSRGSTVGRSIPHSAPAANYVWQPKVADAIRELTNIQITRRDYTVQE